MYQIYHTISIEVNTSFQVGCVQIWGKFSPEAAHARRLLARLGLYPTHDVAVDPGHDYYEASVRNKLLPQAIAHLDRSDLVALFSLAEVLRENHNCESGVDRPPELQPTSRSEPRRMAAGS